MTLGAVMSPLNAMLTLRGLSLYEARVNWVTKQVLPFIEFLKNHPEIEQVNYPWKNSSHHEDYRFPVGLLFISFEKS